MPTTKVRKFQTLSEMELFLNGGVMGKEFRGTDAIYGLRGLTLTFVQPSATSVTFSGTVGSQTPLTFLQVAQEIMSAIPAVKVSLLNGKIVIVESSPSNGVEINSGSTEATRALFGWSSTANHGPKGYVYKMPVALSPVVTPPYFVTAYIGLDNHHICITVDP